MQNSDPSFTTWGIHQKVIGIVGFSSAISLPFLRRESVSCALCVVRCVCTRTLTWTIARLASRSVCLAFRLENVALSVLRTYELIGKIWDELEPSLGLADARRRLRIFP